MAVTSALLVPFLTVLLFGRFTLQSDELFASYSLLDDEDLKFNDYETDDHVWNWNVSNWLLGLNRGHEEKMSTMITAEIASIKTKEEAEIIQEEKNQEIEQLRDKLLNCNRTKNSERLNNYKLVEEVRNLEESKLELLVKIRVLKLQISEVVVNKTIIVSELTNKHNTCELEKNACVVNVLKLEEEKNNNSLQLAKDTSECSKLNDTTDYLDKIFDFGIKLRGEGKYNESLEAFQIAALGREHALGSDDPDTLTAEHWTGTVLNDLERYEEALDVNKQVFKTRLRVLGKDHKDIVSSQNNIAESFLQLRDCREALFIYNEILEKEKRMFGENHENTLNTMHHMGMCLNNVYRNTESLAMFKKAYEGRQKLLGSDHPDTLTSKHSIAFLLKSLRKYDEALKVNQEVLEARRRVLGENNKYTLMTEGNLADVLDDLGRHSEALPIFRSVVEKSKKVWGVSHRETLVMMNNMAACLKKCGKKEEALKIFKEILEIKLVTLGKDHPSTKTTQVWISTF